MCRLCLLVPKKYTRSCSERLWKITIFTICETTLFRVCCKSFWTYTRVCCLSGPTNQRFVGPKTFGPDSDTDIQSQKSPCLNLNQRQQSRIIQNLGLKCHKIFVIRVIHLLLTRFFRQLLPTMWKLRKKHAWCPRRHPPPILRLVENCAVTKADSKYLRDDTKFLYLEPQATRHCRAVQHRTSIISRRLSVEVVKSWCVTPVLEFGTMLHQVIEVPSMSPFLLPLLDFTFHLGRKSIKP